MMGGDPYANADLPSHEGRRFAFPASFAISTAEKNLGVSLRLTAPGRALVLRIEPGQTPASLAPSGFHYGPR